MDLLGADTVTLVWDREAPSNKDLCKHIVFAACYDPPPGAVSLPAYLDRHGDELRAVYVAFIYELGNQDVKGQSLVAALADQEGFSYWWMTHLAEKSPFKSSRIYDCLRLLALERYLREFSAQTRCMVLHGGDAVLATTLAFFCRRKGMSFVHRPAALVGKPGLLRRIYDPLPWRLKGLLSMRHWLRRWSLRRLSSLVWFTQPKGLLFCSYFYNLDGQKAQNGNFYSRQWELLPTVLQRDGWRLNWLHHMLLLPGVSSVRDACDKASRFNSDSARQGFHSFVEAQLGVHLLGSAVLEWLRIGRRARKLRPSLSFTPVGSQLDLWTLLKDDWETSLAGSIGLANCIWRRLFDRALSAVPKQVAGLYLWENQGWEAAFIHAWRRHQRSPIIGFPHATTAFWHLNNFDDQRLFAEDATKGHKPLPDRLAVSGPMAWQMFVQSGYPSVRMAPVEAVRFQHLLQRQPLTLRPHRREMGQPLKLLFLGDFSRDQSRRMGTCLSRAIGLWRGRLELTVKPHPIAFLGQSDLPDLSFTLSHSPLEEILHLFDLAFASNSSSSALDAWLSGLPVAIFLDDLTLNHSPMRGAPGARFVRSAEQLVQVLAEGIERPRSPPSEFFWLDEDMPRWRQLVAQTAGNKEASDHNP